MIPSLLFDLRDALRSVLRDRAHAATTILTLALTLGATTAVFSIVDGVLLKPLAYTEPHRLVAIREIWREFANRHPVLPVNGQHFEHWRGQAASFASLAQYDLRTANLTGRGEAAQLSVIRTTGTLFDVLGVSASIGRVLTRDDERPDRADVVVVTDRLWRRRLNADPAIVGRALALDGKSHTVVGVLPPGVRVPVGRQLSADIDTFIPIPEGTFRGGWVGDHNNAAIGRLKAGVNADHARVELDVLQSQVAAIASKEAGEPITLAVQVLPLAETVVGHARRGLLLLLSAVAAVLLIACSNLANLTLTRTMGRLREAAIRAAIGASRTRLLSRLIVEQLVLAAAGGVGGLLVARAAIGAFVRTAPIDLPRAGDVTVDVRALAFAAAVAIAAGLVVALVPAWHLAAANLQERLRASGMAVTETRGGLRTRGALLALQIAISVTLLIVTALLTASFVRLLRSDPGFDPAPTLAVEVVLPESRYPEPAGRAQVADRVLERVRTLPGVTAAAWTHLLPLAGQGTVNLIVREGDQRPWASQPTANYRYVSADIFTALGIPLRRGRSFLDADETTQTVPAIMTESTAFRMWPNADPIGQRFRWTPNPSEKPVEVVGVVADTKTDIDETPPLMVYMPYWYRPRTSAALVVRAAGDPGSIASVVREAIRAIDPEIAIARARPMQDVVDAALGGRRYQVRLFVAFGATALLIALIGVYGVTAYGVSRRRREMNVRAALGASRQQILGLVLKQGIVPLVVGLGAGLGGALGASGVIASLLFEVRARDPWMMAAVAVGVAAAGVAAAVIAARNGLSLDPAAALRDE